jgi:uncharacterized protein YegL
LARYFNATLRLRDGAMTDAIDLALVDNTSQRLPCVLVLDGSSSMDGPPIRELNAGLRILEEELKKDDIASQRVQLLVIRLGGRDEVEVLSDWTDAMSFSPPIVEASGSTPLGGAVRLALAKIEEQKARYKANGITYNRPWLFVLTDGEPTDSGWEQAAAECQDAENKGRVVVFCIGAGAAELSKLRRFSTRKPVHLDGLKFKELFVWLSHSAKSGSKAAQGTNAQLAPPTDWMQVPA